ncbi:hypothetical protein GCM10028796_20210 [Ramlibacter monticola]|uniref:Uncharacterized protein n=1 Tax=Ramlibacter monticola TaxID=1926872 RepID=A0A936Z0T6_9BURK|nr:hypothetical protein [Ramlibacter monticola]MBL0392277.1 hypothetical protein [Ramlibacter monticola]
MPELPTYFYPFLFAFIAFLGARFLVGRVGDDSASLPGWILYAVAIACVLIGFATAWMDTGY